MNIIHKNPNGNSELDVHQVDERTLETGDVTAQDVGVGFLVKTYNGKEIFVDDEMLKAMHTMMLNRK